MKNDYTEEKILIFSWAGIIFLDFIAEDPAHRALTIVGLALCLAFYIVGKIDIYRWRKREREREAEDRKWEREREAKKREREREWEAKDREFNETMRRLLEDSANTAPDQHGEPKQ